MEVPNNSLKSTSLLHCTVSWVHKQGTQGNWMHISPIGQVLRFELLLWICCQRFMHPCQIKSPLWFHGTLKSLTKETLQCYLFLYYRYAVCHSCHDWFWCCSHSQSYVSIRFSSGVVESLGTSSVTSQLPQYETSVKNFPTAQSEFPVTLTSMFLGCRTTV